MGKSTALLAFVLIAGLACANLPVVSLEVPSEVNAGESFTAVVEVNHLNPGAGHFIDSIKILAGEQVIAEKTFTQPQRSAIFTETIDVSLMRNATLHAEAHCTTHGSGSSSPVNVAVRLQATPTPPPGIGECSSDSDCAPAQCCHPMSCVPVSQMPNCGGIACTMVCMPGTMDCGEGRCACINNSCGVIWRGTPEPTPTIPTPTPEITPAPPTPTPAPTTTPQPGGGIPLTYLGIAAIAIAIIAAAYFYLRKKSQP